MEYTMWMHCTQLRHGLNTYFMLENRKQMAELLQLRVDRAKQLRLKVVYIGL